jgi:hypothetical protein
VIQATSAARPQPAATSVGRWRRAASRAHDTTSATPSSIAHPRGLTGGGSHPGTGRCAGALVRRLADSVQGRAVRPGILREMWLFLLLAADVPEDREDLVLKLDRDQSPEP